MSMLLKLLKHPHRAVFDKTAHGDAAIRLSPSSFISWFVSDGFLSITLLELEGDAQGGRSVVFNDDDSVTVIYTLASQTVQSLVDLLVLDGIVVEYSSPLFLPLSATVLVDGGGSPLTYNVINGFTSLLWSLFGGYAVELKIAKDMIVEAVNQMFITQAEGEWLDLWGQLFRVVKQEEQDDASYRSLIQTETFRSRLNKYSIEEAILAQTGKVVTIQENYLQLFRLDESLLSSNARFGDGVTVGAFIIRPVSSTAIDWLDVLDVINRNRAAGVIVLPPLVIAS